MKRVLIIIPAYNEEESIERVVFDLKKSHAKYDYIVINDCSTDGTESVLERIEANYISLPVNLGIGGAVQTGYQYAKKNGYDIAIQMDGDGQHDPMYLEELVNPIIAKECDICIGSRFIKKEGFQSSLVRRLGISWLSTLIFLCTGKRFFDVTSGYRAVGKDYISFFAKEYPQDYPEPEAIVTAVKYGAKIREIPVKMRARETGVSSINIGRSIYYMLKVSLSLMLACIIYKNRGNSR